MPARRGLFFLACAIVLSACRPGPVDSRSLRVAIPADIVGLDPDFPDATTSSVLFNVVEPLVRFDREMRIVPALATAWRSPDDLTWIFDIRPNVRLHDGTTLSAGLVRSALLRVMGGGSRGLAASIRTVEATGPLTVRIGTGAPEPLLLSYLAHACVVGNPSGVAPTPLASPGRLIGTGPYRLVSWERGKGVSLEAFPEYWGGRPRITRVSFLPTELGEASVRALAGGKVDLAEVPARTVLLKPKPRFRIASSRGLATQFLWLSGRAEDAGRKNPLADRRVRQALSLALDRPTIARKITGHAANAAGQLLPDTVFGYAKDLQGPRFDPAAAREALRAAGYPDGFELELAHRANERAAPVAELVRQMLAEVGIRVRLRGLSTAEFLQGLAERRFTFALTPWIFDDGDAAGFFRDCLHTADPSRGYGLTNLGFSDPEMDRLIEEASTIVDPTNRRDRLGEVLERAAQEAPFLALYHEPFIWGHAPDLDFHPRIDGRLVAFEMGFGKPQARATP